jgi:hypothetical protein
LGFFKIKVYATSEDGEVDNATFLFGVIDQEAEDDDRHCIIEDKVTSSSTSKFNFWKRSNKPFKNSDAAVCPET